MTTQRGFTLIELAIVLVIITILIGGLAVPLSAQIQARRIAETKQIMEEARNAIIGYAMTHSNAPGKRHLPCPDTNGDGREDRDAGGDDCAANAGLLPWVHLGVASQDAWGNRLHYAVANPFANKGIDDGFSVSTTSADWLMICSTHTCTPTSIDVVADNVAFVLVSHGANGWGAQNINNPVGTLLAAPSGPDEAANLDTNQVYVGRAPTKTDTASGEFDDLLTWISFPQLIARVCPTGCSP